MECDNRKMGMNSVLLLLVVVLCVACVLSHDTGRDPTHSHCNFDFLVLLDTSGSIKEFGGEKNWQDVLDFTKLLVTDIDQETTLGVDSRLGIFSYSWRVDQEILVNDNLSAQQIIQFINDGKIEYQNSITRMFLAVSQGRDHLHSVKRAARPGETVTEVTILFTDGVPNGGGAANDETEANVMSVLLSEMNQGHHVVFVGVGSNVDFSMIDAIEQHSFYGLGIKVENFDQLHDVADEIISKLSISCNAAPTPTPAPTPAPTSSVATDIIIVIDDTSAQWFTMSISIVRTFITQIQTFLSSGWFTLRVVSSTQTVPGTAAGLDSLQMTGSGPNLLLVALNRAYNVLRPFKNNGRYKMVWVVHSGMYNYDTGQNQVFFNVHNAQHDNSVRHVVWYLLKYTIGADIYSLPLSTTNPHWLEILQRIATWNSFVFTSSSSVNIPNLISTYAPTYDSCQNLDVVFLLDISSSSNLAQVKTNAVQVLTYLNINMPSQTRVGLVTFSDFAWIMYDFEAGQLRDATTFSAMVTAINNLQQSVMFPMTNLANAVSFTTQLVFQNHGDRMNGTNHVIIFSDAQANLQTTTPRGNAAAILQAQNIINGFILFQTSVDVSGGYTQQTFQNMVPKMNSNNIGQVLSAQLTQSRSCTPASSPITCKNMVIIFDSSGSLEDQGRGGHQHVKDYVSLLITTYYSKKSPGSIAVVHYSNAAKVVVTYKDYTNSYNAAGGPIALVEAAKHLSGFTNVEHAIDLGIQQAQNVPKDKLALVFITDGESNVGMDGAAKVNAVKRDGYTHFYGVFLTNTFQDRHEAMRQSLPDEDELFIEFFKDLPTQANADKIINRFCKA